jgi:hypothetical protein
VRPTSRIREPPQKETNQTADKQPTPSDMLNNDGMLQVANAWRFILGKIPM